MIAIKSIEWIHKYLMNFFGAYIRKKQETQARNPEIWIQALTLTSWLCDPRRDNIPKPQLPHV